MQNERILTLSELDKVHDQTLSLLPINASFRVLVVDDDRVLRKMLALQLESFGLTTDSAASGIEALRQVQLWRYQIVLMDIQMPEMSGLEASVAIRRIERLTGTVHIPIIAVTAGGANRQQCLKMGMSDYLEKPVSMKDLAQVLVKWLPAKQS